MALSSALFAGSSGLSTLGDTMQIIGDNIANVNTIGFKSSKANFQDLLSQSLSTMNGSTQVGSGSAIGDVSASFEQGSFETTGNATDLAIGGDGFFILRETNGEGNYYSRAGNFGFDEDGYMANPDGYIVQGWKLDTLSGTDIGSITDIHLNSFTSSPEESTKIQIIANLDSGGINNSGTRDLAEVWNGAASTPLADSMYEYQTTVQVFDSLGSTHDITIYFDKTASNGSSYEYIITCNPSEDQRALDSTGSTSATADSVATAARTAADVYTTSTSGGTYTQEQIDATEAVAAAAETAAAGAGATVADVADAARTLADDYAADPITTAYTQEEIDAAEAAAAAAETAAAGAGATVNDVAVAARTAADVYANAAAGTYTQEEIDAAEAAAAAAETAAAGAGATVADVAAAARTAADVYANAVNGGTYTQEEIDAAEAAAAAVETEALVAGATVDDVAGAARTLADDYAADPITTAYTQEEIDAAEAAAAAAETAAAAAGATVDSVAEAARTLADNYAADPITMPYTQEEIDAAEAAAAAAETAAAGAGATVADVADAARAAADVYANAAAGTYTQEEIDAAEAAAAAAETAAAGAGATVNDVAAAARTAADVYANAVGSGTYTQAEIDAAEAVAVAAAAEAGSSGTSSDLSTNSGLLASGVIDFGTESGRITNISMGGLDHPSDIGNDLFTFNCDFLGGDNSTMSIAMDFGASYDHETGDWVPDSLSTTQFAVASNTTYKTSDGYGAGELQDINVDEEGIITGTYSNGQMTALYRVALADFQNEDGLVKEGGNLFSATIASGSAITNKPGTNGLGSIAPGSLEQSNVDIADEFVRMITTQRGYQANSKIITTVDTMLSELMNLKR